jgi:geranylgeranyl transferase type-2 subunit beta
MKPLLSAVLVLVFTTSALAQSKPPTADAVLRGLQDFYTKTARADGSFQPGIDPDYRGMSDSAYSDFAAVTYAVTISKTFGWKLPHEEKTIEWILSRQKENGDFVNVAGTVDPASPQGRVYNTTQALVALHALGVKPKYDPLPTFEEILKQDYKTLPAYSTSFFPLAYLCAGKPIPKQADQAIRALMIQDRDGYLNDHVAATFHASHYYALVGDPTPKAAQMLARMLKDQQEDGSWYMNLPARDRHATFDAVFTLLHEGHDRSDCREAIERAAKWALLCRNEDGGFGHYPGSTSDADANYFQVGTLVMAGFLKPADKLPPNPELLSWGHMIPVKKRPGVEKQLILPHSDWVRSIAFNGNGDVLMTNAGRFVTKWDAASGRQISISTVNPRSMLAWASNPRISARGENNGQVLSSGTGSDGIILAWHRGAILALAFSPDESLIASGGIDSRLILSTIATKERRILAGHKSWINSLAFSADGERVVTGSSDGTVKIWNVESGECEKTLDASKAEVRSVAVSPDGKWIAAGIRYGELKLWDADGKEVRAWKSPADDVGGLAFMPDSRRLLVGLGEWNRPGRVEIWDVETNKKVDELQHTGEVLCIAASRDGKLVAAGGGDDSASIWRLEK